MKYVMLDQKFDRKKFAGFFTKRAYTMLAEIAEDRDQGVCDQVIVQDPESKVKIYYMEDYLIDLRYLVLEGKNADKLSEELHQAKDLKALGFAGIEKMVKNPKSKKDLVLGLRMLAVLSPKVYDEKFFKLFRAGLDHKDPQVRFATIQIVTYPKWDPIREYVNRMAQKDPHPEVRGISDAFVKQFDRLTKRKTTPGKKAAAKKSAAKKKVKVSRSKTTSSKAK